MGSERKSRKEARKIVRGKSSRVGIFRSVDGEGRMVELGDMHQLVWSVVPRSASDRTRPHEWDCRFWSLVTT